MLHRLSRRAIAAVCFGLMSAASLSSYAADSSLGLLLAEELALSRDLGIKRYHALAQGLSEQAIADRQLPDPKLVTGLTDLPASSLNLRSEMTEFEVGVIQDFPRGESRKLKGEQTEALASVEQARARETQLQVLRGVRSQFLEAYYQNQAAELIGENRKLLNQLASATRAQYSTGKSQQQDVLRAEVELAMLEDRRARFAQSENIARAELSRWIGEAAHQPLLEERPDLAAIPPQQQLIARLREHPALEAQSAMVEAAQREVDLAKQAYKPGFALDLRYGQPTSDFGDSGNFSAMVMMDLPLFKDKRQDKRLAASKQQALATELSREDRLRELTSMVKQEYTRWHQLNERVALYEDRLLPQSQAAAKAAVQAYQSGLGDFNRAVQAQLSALNARLEALQLTLERNQAHANLLYFAGETQ
jgi:outer membrane protein TolC